MRNGAVMARLLFQIDEFFRQLDKISSFIGDLILDHRNFFANFFF